MPQSGAFPCSWMAMLLLIIFGSMRLPSRTGPTQVSLKSHNVLLRANGMEYAPSAPIQPLVFRNSASNSGAAVVLNSAEKAEWAASRTSTVQVKALVKNGIHLFRASSAEKGNSF